MSQLLTIPIEQLIPRDDQPRQYFDESKTEALAQSMREQGFIGQITVRKVPGNGHYEILAGHRRRKAALLAGITEIPAVVEDLDDQAAREFVLLDNMNRDDFKPWEEGAGFVELIGFGVPAEKVAAKAGVSVATVQGRIAIAETAGQAARQAFIRKDIGIEVLALVSELPNRDLAPVRCPQCGLIHREGTTACSACRTESGEALDLSGEPIIPCGNPQAAAVKLCRGKLIVSAREIIQQVKESYGLADIPVQTSLGFDDVQISEEAVQVKSEFENHLSFLSKFEAWAMRNAGLLAEYDGGTKAAIEAQCTAGVNILRRVQEAVA